MLIHIWRIRTYNGVIAEVAPPARRGARGLVVLAPGCPSVPCAKEALMFLVREGFWGAYVRYGGSWESEGAFLEREPTDDVLAVAAALRKGARDAWSREVVRVDNNLPLFVVGGSFGGPAALFASGRTEVARAVALSPVVDWRATQRGVEPPREWLRLLREGFGGAYRDIHQAHLRALSRNRWYTPVGEPERVDPRKVLVIHAQDDPVVPFEEVAAFARKQLIALTLYRRGGHFGVSDIARNARLWARVARFLARTEHP
ncbi:hypothetical protein D6792_03055 [Candidatus Parcubacteria bacterium]|nr:MAG: hypothetical protein D6792_03055 [Candidatus Parcubacteria bacterium]GIW68774.1 MAG: hypothetical protein KatS3mg100_268 [Candidatus Parcubacteria bacterium]